MNPEREKQKYLSLVINNSLIWLKRLGRVGFSLLNKLVSKDLILGMPNTEFIEDTICNACARGKHVRSTLK